MISGEIEVDQFAEIRLILEAKFGEDPLINTQFSRCEGMMVHALGV